ncbi:hypothetical protein GCM10010358_51180 [Streptomyces minutiscleroticus]|uniref:Uncharacterized protein n=1 Tax=Streptomyces minutiscleroticus TaxID=68238 RepID=A0A918U4N2_9ACTN|nr:hypothetical protein GCM10010358_51180 [Streptomyces minutiscleroticus]
MRARDERGSVLGGDGRKPAHPPRRPGGLEVQWTCGPMDLRPFGLVDLRPDGPRDLRPDGGAG